MEYNISEHENKQLVPKQLTENVEVKSNIKPESVEALNESAKGKGKRKLIVKMEAIHVGKTANKTFYTEEGLKNGLKTWTQPYNKPVLTHHNSYNGEAIGRILEANYSNQMISGKSGLEFTVEITDPQAIEKVLDGRYHTVSIGASTDKVTCNICGTDRTEDWCEHYPGRKYDEQECHFIIGTTNGREVSYVNTPSDVNAGNVSVQVVDGDQTESIQTSNVKVYQMAEGLCQSASEPELNLYEGLNDEFKQMVTTLLSEEVKDPMANEETENLEESKETKEENSKDVTKELNEGTAETSSVMEEALAKLVVEKASLEAKLSEQDQEITRLTSENAKYAAEHHKILAEKVVDLKQKLRKSDVVSKDKAEAIKEHSARSQESLQDTLKDLQIEESALKPEANSVTNPGLAINEEESKGKDSKMTLSEGVSTFMGMFGK